MSTTIVLWLTTVTLLHSRVNFHWLNLCSYRGQDGGMSTRWIWRQEESLTWYFLRLNACVTLPALSITTPVAPIRCLNRSNLLIQLSRTQIIWEDTDSTSLEFSWTKYSTAGTGGVKPNHRTTLSHFEDKEGIQKYFVKSSKRAINESRMPKSEKEEVLQALVSNSGFMTLQLHALTFCFRGYFLVR